MRAVKSLQSTPRFDRSSLSCVSSASCCCLCSLAASLRRRIDAALSARVWAACTLVRPGSRPALMTSFGHVHRRASLRRPRRGAGPAQRLASVPAGPGQHRLHASNRHRRRARRQGRLVVLPDLAACCFQLHLLGAGSTAALLTPQYFEDLFCLSSSPTIRNDRTARDAKTPTVVNVSATTWRNVALYQPGRYTARLCVGSSDLR